MDDSGKRGWVLATLLIFIMVGILAIIHLTVTLPQWGEKKVEWIGALGTVAAFAGTIFIATSESRRRRQDEINVAVLVCLEISHELEWLFEQLAVVDPLEIESDLTNGEAWRAIANALSERAQWSDERLGKLVCIGSRTAERMALAKAQIASGTQSIKTFAAVRGIDVGRKHQDRAVTQLRSARQNLRQASNAMLAFVHAHTEKDA